MLGPKDEYLTSWYGLEVSFGAALNGSYAAAVENPPLFFKPVLVSAAYVSVMTLERTRVRDLVSVLPWSINVV